MSDRTWNRSRLAHRRLFIESLESRRVLAGNVTIALSGSNLYITGDTADNVIDIAGLTGVNASGRVTITPQAGTTLNGLNAPITARSFGDIRITMLRGDDTVNFIGAAGAGDSLLGTLLIDQGEGDNTLAISDYNIGKNLSVKSGAGTDSVTLDNVDVALDILIHNGASGAGTQTTTILDGTTAGRDLFITNGNGTNTVDLSGAAEVHVGRDLCIANNGTGSTNTATLTLSNVAVDGSLFNSNRPVADITLGSAGGPVTVANNTSIRNLNPLGDNNVVLQNAGSTFGSGPTNRLTILNGHGNQTVTFDGVTINGNSEVRNGNGDATVTSTALGTTFNGSLNILNGSNGTNNVVIQEGSVQGDLNIYNGNGIDNTVTLGNTDLLTVGRKLSIRNGSVSGTNAVNIREATITGAVAITNGNGTNEITLGQVAAGAATLNALSSVNIINGNGDSTLGVNNATVGGAFNLRSGVSGAGGHSAVFGNLADNSVGGSVSVSTLGGDSTVTLNQLTIGGSLLIRTSGGDDIITLAGAGAAGLSVTGTSTVDTAAGDDTVTMGNGAGSATFLDFLIVRLGAGTDSLTIGANTANGPGTAIEAGTYYFDGGIDPAGSNSITVNTTVVDPFADLVTLLKFRHFDTIILVP